MAAVGEGNGGMGEGGERRYRGGGDTKRTGKKRKKTKEKEEEEEKRRERKKRDWSERDGKRNQMSVGRIRSGEDNSHL